MRRERPIIIEFFEANKERIGVCLVVLGGASALIDRTKLFVSLEEPWRTIDLIAGSAALVIFTWFAYGVLASMASSLGYTEIAPTTNVKVSSHGNIVTVPARPERQALSEKYDGTDVLSPLDSARLRIIDHIKKT